MDRPLSYEMVVLAADVADVVDSAGGWLCDRVLAGWRVTALLPTGSNTTPLDILGVKVLPFDAGHGILHGSLPRALAVASAVMATDEVVRRDVENAVNGGDVEVTFWGQSSYPGQDDRRIQAVQHRLSDLARAFKTHALKAASSTPGDTAPIENFRGTVQVLAQRPDLTSINEVQTALPLLSLTTYRLGLDTERRFAARRATEV